MRAPNEGISEMTKATEDASEAENASLARVWHSLTEASPLPLIALEGPTHEVRHVNSAFCRLVGSTKENLIGNSFALAVPEDSENGCLALIERTFATGEACSLADQRHTHSGSSPIYWSYSSWAILGADDLPVGGMLQVTDMTEQILTRQELQVFNQSLLLSGLQHQELTEAADAGMQRLRRSVREIDHRAKNNLQIIAALLDMHIMDSPETVSVTELVQLQQCIQTVASLHELLTQTDDDESKTGTISAKTMLEKLLPMWQRLVGTSGFRWRADDLVLPVRKGMSLALLINELVTNSVKQGGKEVELSLAGHDNLVTLTVTDNGPGFALDFDTLKSAHFGLEFVENVVRLELKGRVTYSNHGDGARVTITCAIP